MSSGTGGMVRRIAVIAAIVAIPLMIAGISQALAGSPGDPRVPARVQIGNGGGGGSAQPSGTPTPATTSRSPVPTKVPPPPPVYDDDADDCEGPGDDGGDDC